MRHTYISDCILSLLRSAGFPLPTWTRRNDFAHWITSIQHPFKADHVRWARRLLCHSPRPQSDLFDKKRKKKIKSPETRTWDEAAVPSKTSSCPLTDSHTEEMSNHRFQERRAISYLSAALSAPAVHREVDVLHPDNPHLLPSFSHSPSLIIDDSIGRCETCLRCHHVSIPGRLSHPSGTQILLTVRRPGTSANWNADAEELSQLPEHYSPLGLIGRLRVQLSLILVFEFQSHSTGRFLTLTS